MRQDAVFEVDCLGRVTARNFEASQLAGFRLVRGQLAPPAPQDQARIARAVRSAVADQRPYLIRVADDFGADRLLALALPVRGEARDLLLQTCAVLVIIDPARRSGVSKETTAILQTAFGLTGREAEVVGFVSAGLSVTDAAASLAIGVGTVRVHLKSAMQKMRVHGQVELAALVSRIGIVPG
jgi:DNA-binding CsgD family transcriptional regulator